MLGNLILPYLGITSFEAQTVLKISVSEYSLARKLGEIKSSVETRTLLDERSYLHNFWDLVEFEIIGCIRAIDPNVESRIATEITDEIASTFDVRPTFEFQLQESCLRDVVDFVAAGNGGISDRFTEANKRKLSKDATTSINEMMMRIIALSGMVRFQNSHEVLLL